LNCSKGLVELTRGKKATVQFIHESVRDYLLGTGLLDLDVNLQGDLVGASHERLKQCCQSYILDPSKTTLERSRDEEVDDQGKKPGKRRLDEHCVRADKAQDLVEEGSRSGAALHGSHETYREKMSHGFPFLLYALENLFWHADSAQKSGIEQLVFLQTFPLRHWVRLSNYVEQYPVRRHRDSVSMDAEPFLMA
jgi:hypothetical protein